MISFSLLAWAADRPIQSLRHAFFYLLQPITNPAVRRMDQWGVFGKNLSLLIHADQRARLAERRWLADRLDDLRRKSIEAENDRLTRSLGLIPRARFVARPARVWQRNANDWFQSVLAQGTEGAPPIVGDAVVTVEGDRVAVLGQVTDVFPGGLFRVLLVADPSFGLSAQVARTGEQGLVEGRGINTLLFNYLFSDSDIRVGDDVVTSGLGQVFPEGLWIGRVGAVQEATHESFKRAVCSPAVRLNVLRDLIVLSREDPKAPT